MHAKHWFEGYTLKFFPLFNDLLVLQNISNKYNVNWALLQRLFLLRVPILLARQPGHC